MRRGAMRTGVDACEGGERENVAVLSGSSVDGRGHFVMDLDKHPWMI